MGFGFFGCFVLFCSVIGAACVLCVGFVGAWPWGQGRGGEAVLFFSAGYGTPVQQYESGVGKKQRHFVPMYLLLFDAQASRRFCVARHWVFFVRIGVDNGTQRHPLTDMIVATDGYHM